MESNQMYYLALAVGFAMSLVSFLVFLFSNKTNSSQFYLGDNKNIDPKLVKVVNMVGGDLLSLVPKSVKKKSISNKEIEDAFKASGNPWEVTKMEFFAIRVANGFIFSVVGIIFSIIVQPGIIFSMAIIMLITLLGYNRPLSTYKSIAKKRYIDFKKHFPEMLDYLTMIMGDGNYTLANAIENVLIYLPDSAVKQEFKRVVDAINAGMNTETALNELAGRLPSPALESFVNAVNNANQLNTPMDGLMKTRAKKLREDLLNDIELIIQGLPTKTMLTVAPPAIGSMLVIFLVPVVIALLTTL